MKIKHNTRAILTVTALLVLSIGLASLGFLHHTLLTERDGLLNDLHALEGKAAMLKKSYTEQKAQTESSLRARQAAETKFAQVNQRLSEQEGHQQEHEKEHEKELQGKVEALEAELAKQLESGKKQQEQVRDAITLWKAKVEELQRTNEAGQAKIKEQEAHIAELEGVAASTKASLADETRQHQDCREKNKTLAGTARDLAKSYRKRGVVDLLTTNEPLTQLKKVELEKLVQEYLDRIDTQTLPLTGAPRQ